MFSRTVDPEKAPDKPTRIAVEFEKGNPVAIDGKTITPAALLTQLNDLGKADGIERARKSCSRSSASSMNTPSPLR